MKRKITILALLLGLGGLLSAGIADAAIDWRDDFREAVEEAHERKAPLFIFLGQDG